MRSIQLAINKDKERNSKLLKNISCKTKFTPEDIRQLLNAICFDTSPINLSSAIAVSNQMYRQK